MPLTFDWTPEGGALDISQVDITLAPGSGEAKVKDIEVVVCRKGK